MLILTAKQKISKTDVVDGLAVSQENFTRSNDYNLNSISIIVSNVTGKWTANQTVDSLKNINLTVHCNQLVAIIGPVGSGKVYYEML